MNEPGPHSSPVPVAADALERWHAQAEHLAHALTLIRESIAEPPEDLAEVVTDLEAAAWELARSLGDLVEE